MFQVGPFSLVGSRNENGVATLIEHITIYCQCCTGILCHVWYSKQSTASNVYTDADTHTDTHIHTDTYTYTDVRIHA